MARLPVPEYDAYHAIIQALAPLTPDERVLIMDWVHDCYCPNCGYPAPPDDDECGTCKTIEHP
jgi:hypothetical protein